MKARWLFVLTIALIAQRAMACKCDIPTRDEEIAASHLVFTGIVEEITEIEKESGRPIYAAKIHVVKTIKGKPPNPILIYGQDHTASCNMNIPELKIGQKIEISPRLLEGKYWGSYCSQLGLANTKKPIPLNWLDSAK